MHIFLFALFFVLLASRALGFDLSLAPGLSVKNAFLYMIFIALAIQTALTRQRKLEVLSVFVPFTMYVSYAIFTWVVVLLLIQYPGYSAVKTAMTLKAGPIEQLLVLLVFFYGTTDTRKAMWLFRSIVWLVIVGNSVAVVDTLNILDLGVIKMRDDGRIGGTMGGSPNEYAAFLVLYLPAILAIYLKSNGFEKLLAGVGLVVSGLASLMAVSRGAMVGLAVGGVVGAYYLRAFIRSQNMLRTGFVVVLLCAIVLAGGLATGYTDLLLERVGLFTQGSFDATSGRTAIWGRALDSMLNNPVTFLTGFGWYAYESSGDFNFATHNSYLNILYNLGMIGVALFLLAVGNVLRVIRIAINNTGPEVKPLLIAFVFGFLALLVSILFGELHTAWLFVWAFVGVSLRLAVSGSEAEPT